MIQILVDTLRVWLIFVIGCFSIYIPFIILVIYIHSYEERKVKNESTRIQSIVSEIKNTLENEDMKYER